MDAFDFEIISLLKVLNLKEYHLKTDEPMKLFLKDEELWVDINGTEKPYCGLGDEIQETIDNGITQKDWDRYTKITNRECLIDIMELCISKVKDKELREDMGHAFGDIRVLLEEIEY